MSLLSETCARVQSVDLAIARQTQILLDDKTKPRGSLGVLEGLACRLAAIYGCAEPSLPVKAVVVMAADHGVTEEGISAYPAEVTAQMVANFARGGAAINVLARQAAAQVLVVDMGTRGDRCQGVRDERIGSRDGEHGRCGPGDEPSAGRFRPSKPGSRSRPSWLDTGVGLIGVSEMGIGNTTAASALEASLFTGEPPLRVTGRGTGIDDATWQRKVTIIERALAVNRPKRNQPLDALGQDRRASELAGLAGGMLGGRARARSHGARRFRLPGRRALVAVALCPISCVII